MRELILNKISKILSVIASLIFCAITIVFTFLYVDTITTGFIDKHSQMVKITSVGIAVLLTCTTLILIVKNNQIIYKICIITLFIISLSLSILYLLKSSGFWDRVDSIEDLRAYISSFGANAIIIFIVMQILQVTILPIPGVVAIGAGVALFGVVKGAIFSFIGIMLGTIIAYFIGKCFGYKVVSWLVGKKSLDKVLEKVKNKDKFVLTFMFLFPFFPDDILCFVAGISSMSTRFFLVMIIITRIISVVTTSLSINGSIIPYNTPWGIAIWGVLIGLTALTSYYLYKNGDKIEKFFKKIFTKNKRAK